MGINEYASTAEAAVILGITVDRLRLLARRGDIPSVQVGKGPRLFDPKVIEEFKSHTSKKHAYDTSNC